MSDATAERVRVAKRLGMHPQQHGDIEFSRLSEGEHYDVVAYTDWADMFVPTVVRWAHAETVDRLDDEEVAVANARRALNGEVVDGE